MNAVLDSARPQASAPKAITTTLFEVIEAMQEVADSQDEGLIVATVMDLLRSGKVTFLHPRHVLNALAYQGHN